MSEAIRDAPSDVDASLVAATLRLSVEERLLQNDRALNTIRELQRAFREIDGGRATSPAVAAARTAR
jgi:hypothetical protein